MGKDGSAAYFGNTKVYAEAFVNPDTIETTGAGDTFCACVLNYILDHDLDSMTPDQLEHMLCFANAAASLVTTKKGALRVMPTQQQVEEYMRNYQK
jgi:fructokinase